jgi:hypothetical protein
MQVGNADHEPLLVVQNIKNQLMPMSPGLATVFDHWMNLVSASGRVPNRQEISPEELATTLSHVWLCDFDAESGRFRYRLGGEHVTTDLGSGMRGRYLDELTDPDVYPRVHAYFRKCVDLPAVLYVSGRIYAEQSRVAIGERIMLPYSADSGPVSGILGATFRNWSDTDPGHGEEIAITSRRHVYFHLADGSSEVEDITLP